MNLLLPQELMEGSPRGQSQALLWAIVWKSLVPDCLHVLLTHRYPKSRPLHVHMMKMSGWQGRRFRIPWNVLLTHMARTLMIGCRRLKTHRFVPCPLKTFPLSVRDPKPRLVLLLPEEHCYTTHQKDRQNHRDSPHTFLFTLTPHLHHPVDKPRARSRPLLQLSHHLPAPQCIRTLTGGITRLTRSTLTTSVSIPTVAGPSRKDWTVCGQQAKLIKQKQVQRACMDPSQGRGACVRSEVLQILGSSLYAACLRKD